MSIDGQMHRPYDCLIVFLSGTAASSRVETKWAALSFSGHDLSSHLQLTARCLTSGPRVCSNIDHAGNLHMWLRRTGLGDTFVSNLASNYEGHRRCIVIRMWKVGGWHLAAVDFELRYLRPIDLQPLPINWYWNSNPSN